MKALPSSGPSASSAAASTSQSTAPFSSAVSGSAARSSSARRRGARRRGAGPVGVAWHQLGIERGLSCCTRHCVAYQPPCATRSRRRAALGDAAVAQHHDLVGVEQGRQAVAGDDHRAALALRAQCGQDVRLGAGVHGRERVVEQQQGRVGQQRARDRHALALAARQRDAALAHRGVVALGQALDVVVHRRLARRGLDLGAAWRRAAPARCSRPRGREQEGLLRHPGDARAQRRQRVVGQRPGRPSGCRPAAASIAAAAASAACSCRRPWGPPAPASGPAGRCSDTPCQRAAAVWPG